MGKESVLLRCGTCNAVNRVPTERLGERPICGKCKTLLSLPRTPVDATQASFQREVFDWPGLVLVEFWSRSCGYCRLYEPVMDDLANRRAGRMKVVKVEVNEEPALSSRFNVHATPTFILFRNGQALGRLDGAPKEKIELVMWIDKISQP
ncbi:MAG: thioredoxin family protein [bacterium]